MKIDGSITHSDITATLPGNPFTIQGVVGSNEGRFIGMSFIEIRRGDRVIHAKAACTNYGVEHHYEGEDAEALTALCAALNRDLESQYAFQFLVREPASPIEEPQPPTENEEGE